MSEVLTFNTESGIVQQEDINPLDVYGEDYFGLHKTMPEYDVTTLPNPVMTKLVKRMKMTMKMYNGLGLSANQCGVFERVFVIGTDQFQITCINPVVTGFSAEMKKNKEGCLSFPGLFVTIDRPVSCDVEFYDENGQKQTATLDGLTAQCFLHELDHLNGTRMIDRVKPLALQMARQKQQKLVKKVTRLSKNGIRI
jgi:peptide deformylase